MMLGCHVILFDGELLFIYSLNTAISTRPLMSDARNAEFK